jgi:hypothetical protein
MLPVALPSPPSTRHSRVHTLTWMRECNAGDKSKQKDAGSIIRELKEEMVRLGLSEAEAASIIAADAAAKGNGGGKPGSGRDRGAAAAKAVDDEAEPSGEGKLEDSEAEEGDASNNQEFDPAVFDLFGDGGSSAAAAGKEDGAGAAGKASAGQAGTTNEGEVDWAPTFDLFGDDGSTAAEQPAAAAVAATSGHAHKKAAAAPATPPESVNPWGSEGAGSGAGRGAARLARLRAAAPPPPSRAKAGAKGAAASDARQPKALLSQHCQKVGWPQPRFERLPDGLAASGGALGDGGVIRYAVTIDMGNPKNAAAKKKGLVGVRRVVLDPEEDGWASIQVCHSLFRAGSPLVVVEAGFWLAILMGVLSVSYA